MKKGFFELEIPKECTTARESSASRYFPKNHNVSRLVVRRPHGFQSGHSGKEYALSLIMQRFWTLEASPLVKRILSECVVYRRLRGKPGVQQMADLPVERVTPAKPPFCYVGVDCFGLSQ